MNVRFVAARAKAAACHPASGMARGSAAYVLTGIADAPLAAPPIETLTSSPPGRVVSAGQFTDAGVLRQLRAQLPCELQPALRQSFEWYACRGAYFHTDAHYSDVLFGAWSIAGPARTVVFSRTGIRIDAPPGTWLIFDPFEPHAVLDRDASTYRRDTYEEAPPSVFIGFELTLTEAVCRAFAIGPAAANSVRLASDVPVNAETGNFAGRDSDA